MAVVTCVLIFAVFAGGMQGIVAVQPEEVVTNRLVSKLTWIKTYADVYLHVLPLYQLPLTLGEWHILWDLPGTHLPGSLND